MRAGKAAFVLAMLAVATVTAQVGLGAFGAEAAPAAPVISSAPLRPTVSTRATLAFDRQANLAYECGRDDGTYAPCSNPVTFAGLSRSNHTFRVRARTPTGATSSASTYTWTIVAPRRRLAARSTRSLRPTMTTAPIRPYASRNATFAWLAPRARSAECRLDGARWRRCANPKTYLGLTLGRHVFRVRTVAAGGHRSRANRFTWTITSSPAPAEPTITSGPDGTTTSTSASFEFDVADGDAAQCRLDSGAWIACSSPAMYVGLAPGVHLFCVRAVNGAGVVGAESCVAWTIVASPSAPEPSSPFTITSTFPGTLTPGSSQVLPLRISNPFGFAIRVTSITVTIRPGSSQAGCDGQANLAIAQSNTSGGSISFVVPAQSSVTLPQGAATAPTVAMLDLPTNQDACKGAVFTADYSGTGVQT